MKDLFFLAMTFLLVGQSCSIFDFKGEYPRTRSAKTNQPATTKYTVYRNVLDTNQVRISGHILDHQSEEPLLFASIAVYHQETLIWGAETDFDGNFVIDLDQQYQRINDRVSLHIKYVGYEDTRITDLKCRYGDHLELRIEMMPVASLELVPWIRCGPLPLIKINDMGSGQTFTSEQIQRSPTRG